MNNKKQEYKGKKRNRSKLKNSKVSNKKPTRNQVSLSANEEFKRFLFEENYLEDENKKNTYRSVNEKEGTTNIISQIEKDHIHIFSTPLEKIIKKQKQKYSAFRVVNKSANKVKINSLVGKNIVNFIKNQKIAESDKNKFMKSKELFKNMYGNNEKCKMMIKFNINYIIYDKFVKSLEKILLKNEKIADGINIEDDIFNEIEDNEVITTNLDINKSKPTLRLTEDELEDDIFKYKNIDLAALLKSVKKF